MQYMQETVEQSVFWEERPFLTSWKLQDQVKVKSKVKKMNTKEVMSGKKTVRRQKISKAADLETPQVYETKIPWIPKP